MILIICDTSILCRNLEPHKEFRKTVKGWLKTNYLNESFINQETGYEIFINNTFIEKVTSSFGDIKAHALTAIPEIIKHSIFINAEDDKRDRPDIIKVLKFIGLIEVEFVQYEVWIYVRQSKTQMQLYSININAQKTP